MPYNARFLYQQPKTEINNYLIVNWFSLPLQTVEKHLVSTVETNSFHTVEQTVSLDGTLSSTLGTSLKTRSPNHERQNDIQILPLFPIFAA
ncbi:hypothetical protein [Bacteroides clarus]|uniref:hypothetical protein n=1 Tax=Bacteroides clarus TaxID=626929 RepID=UPI0039795A66